MMTGKTNRLETEKTKEETKPEIIINYIPAEKWQDDISKIFK